MSGGRESPATENLGRAPRGGCGLPDPGPRAVPVGGIKSQRPPRLQALQLCLAEDPCLPPLPSPGAIAKRLGKRLTSPGLSDPCRFQSAGATAPLRAVHNSESPRTRFVRPHLPPPPGRPLRLPTSPPQGSAAHWRQGLRSPPPRAGRQRAAAAATGLPRWGSCAPPGPSEGAEVGWSPHPARVLTCCCFLGRPRPLF